MTLTPNTQITQENVGLLKAGDWLHDGFYDLWQFDRIENGVACGQDGYTAMILDAFYRNKFIGPDLGDGWIGHSGGACPVADDMMVTVRCKDGSEDTERSDCWTWNSEYAPIIAFRPALSPPAEVPFAAEDACLACNSLAPVDWTVVGPKLVEALDGARSTLDSIDCVLTTDTRAAGAARQAVKRIDAALAAAQPQSNGE